MYGVIVEVKTDPNSVQEDARAAVERIRPHGPLAGGRVDVENIDTYEVLYQTQVRARTEFGDVLIARS